MDATTLLLISMMIPHHASAISMAQEALDTTARPQFRTLSHNIIDTQTGEIGQCTRGIAAGSSKCKVFDKTTKGINVMPTSRKPLR